MSKDHGFSPTDLASGPGKSRARPGDAIKESLPCWGQGIANTDEPPQILARKKQARPE